jgi:predicted ATPase/transcriptional regulator with XRE-family HTH domain
MGDGILFGHWLKQRRKALDLTQTELAQRVGCTMETIRKIEADVRRPSRQITELLAEQLAIPPDQRAAFIQAARAPRAVGADIPATHAPALSIGSPQPARPLAPHSNLPCPPTPLIGRADDAATLRDRLSRDTVRLLTLTGPPGVGKTRLALHAAAELSEEFADGVFFIGLAAIGASQLTLSTIARALDIEETKGRSTLDCLVGALRDRQILLALDNFEQLLPAAPLLAELLAAAPRLKLLVTSRAALRLAAEHEFPVAPLALPDLRRLPPLAALADCPSIALFVARAQAVKPNFALTSAEAPAVAAICCRLDGVPLAIELAAARIKLFAPQALLARLGPPHGSALQVLTGGPRDLPARQQTLRDAIAWSYDLLADAEQALFRRLGVFVGGCTLETAEAVASECRMQNEELRKTSDDPSLLHSAFCILHLIEALVDQGLLQRIDDANGEPRFVMLATIREYACERLVADGEMQALQQRHAQYFLALAEASEAALAGPDQGEWLARLEREHDNLRAAISWALESGATETALRLGAALRPFWRMHGYLSEGRRWLAAALACDRSATIDAAEQVGQAGASVSRSASSRQRARAKALNGAGVLAFEQGDYAHAQACHEESLALHRAIADTPGIAAALHNLGVVALLRGDYQRGWDIFEAALVHFRAMGDRLSISRCVSNLGIIAKDRGDYARARALQEEGLALKREIGNQWGIAVSLQNLAVIALDQGDYARARALQEEGLALYREIGDRKHMASSLYNLGLSLLYQADTNQAQSFFADSLALFRELEDLWGIALILHGLGHAALDQGESQRARSYYADSLVLRQEQADMPGIAQCLEGLAAVAGARRQPLRAARLWGTAEALREMTGVPLTLPERARHIEQVADVRSHADQAAFNAAWAEGRALPLEQAAALALEGQITRASRSAP